MKVALDRVSKSFSAFSALDDVSVTIEHGELVALLGPSGSGKTTLLRLIAGLEQPTRGRIHFDGADVTDIPPRERGVGLVFQHYALFRHMDVFENVAFPMRVKKEPKARVAARVAELLALVRLQGLEHRRPDQLSGGQRQRVALARALAAAPRVLLLDEPFGALDAKVRFELRRWLRRLHDELEVTTIFVTHDQEEAFEVADRVVITNQARIAQIGTPVEVVERPANRFVFDFLGQASAVAGVAREGRAFFGPLEVEAPQIRGDQAVVGYVRPEEIDLSRRGEVLPWLAAVITHIHPGRVGARVELLLEGLTTTIEAEIGVDQLRALELVRGQRIFALPRKVHVFSAGEDVPRVA